MAGQRPSRAPAVRGTDVLVPVADVAAACRFYVEAIGLVCERQDQEFASLRAGEGRVWLHREDSGSVPTDGVELWFSVDDVDVAYDRCVAAGHHNCRAPQEVEAWGLRFASVVDPDGRRVYLSQPL